MATVKVKMMVESVESAEEASKAAAGTTARWEVIVPRLDRLDSAPTVLNILLALTKPPPPRQGWSVKKIRKLRSAARVSSYLGRIVEGVAQIIADPHHRLRRSSRAWGKMLRQAGTRLPVSAQERINTFANMVQRATSRGSRYTEKRMLKISAKAEKLQGEPIDVDPKGVAEA